jgi:hypothetical protein
MFLKKEEKITEKAILSKFLRIKCYQFLCRRTGVKKSYIIKSCMASAFSTEK